VLLRLARNRVFLALLSWISVTRYRAFSDQHPLYFVQPFLGRVHNARVDHLTAARNVAVLGELAIDRLGNALAGTGLDQPLLKCPDRGPIRNLVADTKTDEKLEAQIFEKLEFHLLIGEVKHLLDRK